MKYLVGFFLASSLSFGGFSQCNYDSKIDNCSKELGENFTFLKMFDLNKKGEVKKLEFSNVLSKGNVYKLQTCSENENPTIVKLYDRSRHLIASNYNQKTGQFYKSIAYKCKSTDIYYLEFESSEVLASCSYGVLGFQ